MTKYKDLSDTALLALLKKGSHTAFTEIYNRYYTLLFVHAYKKLNDEDLIRDFLHDVFTNLWYKREQEFNATNLPGYLYTAVRNKILDYFGHQNTVTKYLNSLNDFSKSTYASTDYLVRENELQATIQKEIQALPKKMRAVFELNVNENLNYREISEKLNISENNVAKHVNGAKKILRTKLGGSGIALLLLFKAFL